MDDPLVRTASQADRVVQRLNKRSVNENIHLPQQLADSGVWRILQKTLIPVACETNEIEILFLARQAYQRGQPGSLFHGLAAGECQSANRLQIELVEDLEWRATQSRNKRDPLRRKAAVAVEGTALYPDDGARTGPKCMRTRRNSRNVQDMGNFRLLGV